MQVLPVGRGRCLTAGTAPVAVLSLGHIGNNVAKAVAAVNAECAVAVSHYDMIFLKPIDETILAEVASKVRCIITVEDGTATGGLGGAVAEWLTSRGSGVKLVRLGLKDAFIDQGTVAQQQHACGIDVESITQTIKNELSEL